MHPDHTEAKKMVPRSENTARMEHPPSSGCRKYSNGHAPVPQDSQDYVYTKQSPKYLILTCPVDFSALRAGRSLWSLPASEVIRALSRHSRLGTSHFGIPEAVSHFGILI